MPGSVSSAGARMTGARSAAPSATEDTMRRRGVLGEFVRICLARFVAHDQAVTEKLKAEREAALEEWRQRKRSSEALLSL